MNPSNRVVLITGASTGIGAATARLFARAGARLALVARSADTLEALAAELRAAGAEALALPADVSVKTQVERVVAETGARFGRLDVLVNNAGRGVWGAIDVLNNDHLREVFELNVYGALYAMQAAAPRMRESGGGVIVNVSSMVSKLNLPYLGGYAASKYALNALSHAARLELAPQGIRVVTLYPGRTATDFGKNTLGGAGREGGQGGPAPDPPEKVARKILAAVTRPPRDQYMDVGSRILAFASALVPAWIDALFARTMRGAVRERS